MTDNVTQLPSPGAEDPEKNELQKDIPNWQKGYEQRGQAVVDFYNYYILPKDKGKIRELFLRSMDNDLQDVSKYLLFLELAKWMSIDLFRSYKKRPFGTYLYCGLYGQGKTLSMIAHVKRAKQLYGNDLKVYSNIPSTYADDLVYSIDDIVNCPGDSIVKIDELTNTFQARDYKNFPPEVVPLLTMQRKFAKQIVCTAQLFEHVDKFFRDLTLYVVQCNNIMPSIFNDRLFRNYFFTGALYERCKDFDKLDDAHEFTRYFVATDKMRNAYNTLEIVKSLTKVKGETREWMSGSSRDVILAKVAQG